jgi:hypothetical protein
MSTNMHGPGHNLTIATGYAGSANFELNRDTDQRSADMPEMHIGGWVESPPGKGDFTHFQLLKHIWQLALIITSVLS